MRRVRRKAGNKEKVFGCDLLEHLTASNQEIPQVLRYCSEFVEQHGIVDGIYRLSGVSSNIQKLRGEFEGDGAPDLNKDVYLQDIHCVSSLCKAYFRELPNPLLTYQLYDKFAEAVAIQLEEERLVKIRDVLKELPTPHHRTLEFLMRHLVRVASFSSETNMHARNLAIVWAPNLLRSKDIEASGFNGTAAFMEVRVQSIVVEFILTHVPQLFPEPGVSSERRKSLPSPSAITNQEEVFFKSVPFSSPVHIGNISPGDGPLPIRPYHSIIEGTDKRKGSLKGRKWMSIFNIGGRFHDSRRRHKHSTKEKEQPTLRSAKSMDSLSTPTLTNDGSRHPSQRPPSSNISPLAAPSPQPGSEVGVSAVGGSEYAVTYRRGTGIVSGGTQGTYTALDPEGVGAVGNDTVQSRSPGISAKAGRRAAMHITGPTMVTVPLHITSNLALGVLQGGGGDRIIHRGRDKDVVDKGEAKEGGEKVERRMAKKVEGGEEEKLTDREEEEDAEEKRVTQEGGEEEDHGEEEEEKEETEEGGGEECRREGESAGDDREQRTTSVNCNPEDEDEDEDGVCACHYDVDNSDEYMEMKGVEPSDGDEVECDADILSSTEVEGDVQGLSGYVQDNFEFLDQMDCSVMDHMDCSVSYQVNEFSVEPPGHSDDEYEVMEDAELSNEPAELQIHMDPLPQTHTHMKPHRPLSLDLHNRHTKSFSLPYMSTPVRGAEELSSEDDDEDDNDYSSEEDDSMFVRSNTTEYFLRSRAESAPGNETEDQHIHLSVFTSRSQSCGGKERLELRNDHSASGGQEWEEHKNRPMREEHTPTEEEEEVNNEEEQLENKKKSTATVDSFSAAEELTDVQCCLEVPPPQEQDIQNLSDYKKDSRHSDYPPCEQKVAVSSDEFRDVSVQETESNEGEDGDIIDEEGGDTCPETAGEELTDGDGLPEEKRREDGKEEDTVAPCRPSCEIWDELEEVVLEVIEDEERNHTETKEKTSGEVENDGDEVKLTEEAVGEEEEGEEEEEEEEEGEEEEEEEEEGEEEEEEEEEGGEEEEEDLIQKTEGEVEVGDQLMHKNLQEKESDDVSVDGDKLGQDKNVTTEEEVVSKELEKENQERDDKTCTPPPDVDRHDKCKQDVSCDMSESKEGRRCDEADVTPLGGFGRKLVTSRQKTYQVKAVPVVPPKPQHCKITALTLRQQQQQRERRDANRAQDEEAKGEKERPAPKGGDRRRDHGDEGTGSRDASRSSPISMCFDEAVAIATLRRGKGKESEKEKERHRDWAHDVQ